MTRIVLGALLALLLLPAVAAAHGEEAPIAPAASPPPECSDDRTGTDGECPPDQTEQQVAEACPGEAIDPDRVITGEFSSERQRSFVFLPFKVPSDTTAVRVKYCFDQPDAPISQFDRNTLDLGLYEPRRDKSKPWGVPEFRGWGGSSHPDVTVSPEGFSSEAQYEADPEKPVPGKTTRAFRPGPIPAGRWAVELGLAALTSEAQGNTDGKVAYRVEIELSDNPRFADKPYKPAKYDSSPASTKRGWYAGDFHVHAEHSALGDAPMREVFDYAFGSLADDKAGLDFITLSDYVSGSSWNEIGRFQEDYPKKLIIRSTEVITYRGHLNSHANTRSVDYREGVLFQRRGDGGLERLRGTRDARKSFSQIHDAGGFTQINHPTIFPSPPFPAALCRGCPWEYSDAETDYSEVDGIEIATGPAGLQGPGEPGPNPFTVTGIEFWEDALDGGNKIAAVGSSDSHNAGRTPSPVTQAPIGTATTMVRADELSEDGIQCGVEAGHTYVKVTGNDGPDIRFRGRRTGANGRAAIMGDTIPGDRADFTARVLDGSGLQLIVFKGRNPMTTVPVTSDDFTLPFKSSGPGRYRLQLQQASRIETVSSPIYLQPGAERRGEVCAAGEGGQDRDGRSFRRRPGSNF